LKHKIRSFIRVLIVGTMFVTAIRGTWGVGLQVVALVVFLTAYREAAADWLRNCLSEAPTPQTDQGRGETAFHEAGHAVVGWVLPGACKPNSASILQTAGENGRVDCEERSGDPPDIQSALDELASWQAGYAAEQEFGCRSNAGCHEDLMRATELATQMVCEWGFSAALGRRHYDPASDMLTEEIRAKINAEIDRFLADGETLARKTVREHHDAVGRVAGLLLQHGKIDRKQLQAAIENGA